MLPDTDMSPEEAITYLRSPAMAASGDILAVNLSSKAFADDGLFSRIEHSLRGRPDDARRLVFEVTETAAICAYLADAFPGYLILSGKLLKFRGIVRQPARREDTTFAGFKRRQSVIQRLMAIS